MKRLLVAILFALPIFADDPRLEQIRSLLASRDSVEQARGAAIADAMCGEGSGEACDSLALAYAFGRGVTKDEKKGFELKLRSCELGYGHGCSAAGLAYIEGEGVKRNPELGLKYSTRGCDLGDSTGCNNVGVYYRDGKGVEKDVKRALELFEKACRLGGRYGCGNLGAAYDDGKLVPRDAAYALEFYDLSCDLGLAEGCQRGASLARREKLARFPSRIGNTASIAVVPAAPTEIFELRKFFVGRGDNVEARKTIVDAIRKKIPSLTEAASAAPAEDVLYVSFSVRLSTYVGEAFRIANNQKRVLLTERYPSGVPLELARQFAKELVDFYSEARTRPAALQTRFVLRPTTSAVAQPANQNDAAAVPEINDRASLEVVKRLEAILDTELSASARSAIARAAGEQRDFQVVVGRSLTKEKKAGSLLLVRDGEFFSTALSDDLVHRYGVEDEGITIVTGGTGEPTAAAATQAKLTKVTVRNAASLRRDVAVDGTVAVDGLAKLPAEATLRVTIDSNRAARTFYLPIANLKRKEATLSFSAGPMRNVADSELSRPLAVFVDVLEAQPDSKNKEPRRITNTLMTVATFEPTPAAAAK